MLSNRVNLFILFLFLHSVVGLQKVKSSSEVRIFHYFFKNSLAAQNFIKAIKTDIIRKSEKKLYFVRKIET